MEFEIMENTTPVTFDVPSISFPAYEAYKERAADIAEQINSMDVDPENIKEAKRTLAEARKITDRLSRARIDIKKAILSNYDTFERQVKEISAIIGDADDALRSKVRELEEAERRLKEQQIRKIWDLRVSNYPEIVDLFPEAWNRWFKPQFLNKTMALKKVEADMTAWLEKTDRDMTSAKAISNECFIHYLTCGDLTMAIQSAKELEELENKIAEMEEEPGEEKALFLITGTKNIKLTEMLLKENDIKFERK